MSRPIGYRAKKSIPAAQLAAQEKAGTAVASTGAEGVVFNATDSARQLAAEHNINLADLTGSGVDGRITKGDVELAIAAAGAARMETTGGEQ
jgi:pyruvate/2-oxoglutarate dehydrogenase complex dihydrolipoamide acyltransferase (E2) component